MTVYRFNAFELDTDRFELRRAGQSLPLHPKAFDLARYLIENRTRVVAKEELLGSLWPDTAVAEASLTRAVSTLRKALDDDPGHPEVVKTVHRRGYQFVAEIAHTPAPVAAAPAPPVPSASSTLVGRDRELGELRRELGVVMTGRGRLVLLCGEAGIGKTRTARELAAHAAELGARVRFANCPEVEGAPPFWPWVQILRSDLDALGAESMRETLGSAAEAVADWLPGLRDATPGETGTRAAGGDARFQLFDGIARYLKRLAPLGPGVLVFDDLHRTDPSTLQLLRFVAGGLHEIGLLLLGTYRDAEAEMDPGCREILAATVREAEGRVLPLAGLELRDITSFLEASTGRAPEPRTATRLWEQTGGNPFFLTQLVTTLRPDGSAAGVDDATSPGLLDGIRTTLLRQLAVLPETLTELLTYAAIVGRSFDTDLIGRLADLELAKVSDLLEQAVAARILVRSDREPGVYAFVHLLLRDVLYQRLPAPRRAELHRRVGETLETLFESELDAHFGSLAHHFIEASLGGADERAAHYSTLAGDAASDRLAHEEAVRHYTRALRAGRRIHRDVDHCDLLLKLGLAQSRAGFRSEAQRTCQRAADLARRTGSAERLARAALALSPGLYAMELGVVDTALVGLLQEALDGLPPEAVRLRAHVMARLALALQGSDRDSQRARLSSEALELARRAGDRTTLAFALSAEHVGMIGRGDLENQIRVARKIIEVADPVSEPETSLMYRMILITHLLEQGSMADLDRELLAFSRAAHDLQQPQSLWQTVMFRGMRALMTGRFAEAEKLAEEFVAIGRRIQDRNALQAFGVHFGLIRLERGPLAEARAGVEQYLAQFPEVATWRACLASIHAREGRRTEARRHFETLAADDFARVPRDSLWACSMAYLAEACFWLDDGQRAVQIFELLEPYAERNIVIGYGVACLGSTSRHLGALATTLGRTDEAARHLERSIELDTRIGARPFVVRAEFALARLLQARDRRADRARADELSAKATDEARELGMLI